MKRYFIISVAIFQLANFVRSIFYDDPVYVLFNAVVLAVCIENVIANITWPQPLPHVDDPETLTNEIVQTKWENLAAASHKIVKSRPWANGLQSDDRLEIDFILDYNVLTVADALMCNLALWPILNSVATEPWQNNILQLAKEKEAVNNVKIGL